MQTLLQIKTSLFSDNGESSRLSNRFASGWSHAENGQDGFAFAPLMEAR